MNLDELGAKLQANKPAALAAAGAGVVGLALYRKHKGGTAAGAAGAAGAAVAGVSGGGQVAGMTGAGGVYDSSASDLYGAVQPQLESLGNQLTDLQSKMNQVPVAAPPAPAPPPPPPPAPVFAPPPPPVFAPPPPPPVPVSAPSHAVDTWIRVNAGDSLSRIAARYPQQDITWQSIYNDNRGVIGGNANLIHPGQMLHVVG